MSVEVSTWAIVLPGGNGTRLQSLTHDEGDWRPKQFSKIFAARACSLMAQTKRNELLSLVQLYKALGGGWQQ
ncbi:MAG TPA: hypothetical protein VE135_09220 [Pyrinomonadaceae bacterium]|nr:hypothetical protein [Pyrinomonadaceae bacterium]